MKNLIFSLSLFTVFILPTVLYALDQQDLLDYINSQNGGTSVTTSNTTNTDLQAFFNKINGSTGPVDDFSRLREGETASQYIQRIQIENQQRSLRGEALLPDPLQSTTQIPTNNGVIQTPLDGKAPPIPRTTSNISNNSYQSPTRPTIFDQIAPPGKFGGQPVSKLLNQIFYMGLSLAVILAIVMIIRGGVQYMTIDAATSKDSGKKMVQAALGGLVLAFASILILNTINPNLTSLNLNFKELNTPGTLLEELPISSIPREGSVVATGDYGEWNETTADNWINSLNSGSRSTDGRLVVSVYSATGDAITDSNTAARRGNANNLLREGSVALSPDLIQTHRPTHGSEIFINGTSVGFYEDTTAASYNGVQFRNTIDIYDENGSLGSRNILNNIPAGQWNITFGAPRTQIKNP